MSCETNHLRTRSAPGVVRSPGPYRKGPIIGACACEGPIIINYVNFIDTCALLVALALMVHVCGGWLLVVVAAAGAWGLLRATNGTHYARSDKGRDPPPALRLTIYSHPQGRKLLKAVKVPRSGLKEA